MRAFTRFVMALASVTVVGAGCSAIVSSDVPKFTCTEGAANACPTGQACVGGVCVVPTDGTTPEDSGEEGSVEEGGKETGPPDVDAGPLPLGSACRVNVDCASKLCGTSTVLTNAIIGGTGPICTTPCCRSLDCANNFVCINPGTGGGYCIPPNLAGRTPSAGGKGGGATCTQDNECRSGKCELEDGGTTQRCLDTCCGDSECSGGAGVVCRLRKAPMPSGAALHYAWVCADQAGNFNPGTFCSTQDQCKSEVCIPPGGVASSACRPPCSNSAACRALGGSFSPNGRCVYGLDTGDYFHFCQQNAGGATGAKGSTCTNPGDCISGYCDDETDKCLEVCAKDSDCLPTETCKPSGVTTPFLRCVPK